MSQHALGSALIGFISTYKMWISLFGVALLVLSWFIDHSEPVSFLDRLIFRSYANAVHGLQHGLDTGTLLPADPGFQELARLFERQIPDPSDARIIRLNLTVVARGRAKIAGRTYLGTQTRVKITLATGQTDERDIENLDEVLQAKYRDPAKRFSAGFVFWLGVAIQIVLAFV